MEQLSRSLQTERNSLKQAIKDLEEKLNINEQPKQQEQVQEETASTATNVVSEQETVKEVEQTTEESMSNNE
jgi:hypothetical protein